MALQERITIRLFGEEKCFGPGIAQLLERVEEHHSLRAAAISMHMAYSKAWSIIRTSEASLGFPLLESVTGGKGGGGAILTEQARSMLARYRQYQAEVGAYARERFEVLFGEYIK